MHIVFSFLIFISVANATRVFTCEPEWAALVLAIDPTAEVVSATTTLQDPHVISAKPSLIMQARNADFMICSGAELEVGWLPILLAKSGKSDADVIYAAKYVKLLDVPNSVDRADGDVHPDGNPHVHLNPHNIPPIADVVATRLGVSPETFRKKWVAAVAKWETKVHRLKGKRAITHHKNMAYLFAWLGIVEVGNLEPKPGIPPTAAHLAKIANVKTDYILYTPFENPEAAEWLSKRTGIRARQIPFSANDLFVMFDKILEVLNE